MTTREEYIRRGARAIAVGVAEAMALIEAGRAEEAARAAGCRTDAQIDAYLAEFAPGQRRQADREEKTTQQP